MQDNYTFPPEITFDFMVNNQNESRMGSFTIRFIDVIPGPVRDPVTNLPTYQNIDPGLFNNPDIVFPSSHFKINSTVGTVLLFYSVSCSLFIKDGVAIEADSFSLPCSSSCNDC